MTQAEFQRQVLKRLDRIDAKLDRHGEILVNVQVAVSSVQQHLGLVPADA